MAWGQSGLKSDWHRIINARNDTSPTATKLNSVSYLLRTIATAGLDDLLHCVEKSFLMIE
jgi:hypothetical protein